MKKFLEEFKTFALRGNVLDLAVGVIIGAAFQSIVTSLTQDIISPILGVFSTDQLSNLTLKVNNVQIGYGAFLNAILNFIIMALVVFFIVKGMNKLLAFGGKKEKAADARKCPYCCSVIDQKATRCPSCTSQLPEDAKLEG